MKGTLRQSGSYGSMLGAKSKSHKQLLLDEFNWNENFNVMASKNNKQVHINYKEYFDKPFDYDVRGYTYSQTIDPMKIYDSQTPIVETLLS